MFPPKFKARKIEQLPAWAQRLEDYLGPATVISATSAARMTAMAEGELVHDFKFFSKQDRPRIDVPGLEEFRVLQVRGGYLVATGDGREPVASYGIGMMPYVVPDYRGRGICSHLHVYHDTHHGQRRASSYSNEGFSARRRAHALHVAKALAAGENVPGAVRAQYRAGDNGLELKEPYSPEEHNAWVKQERDASLRRDYERFTENYPVRYAQLSHYMTGLRSRFAPTAPGGVAFAARLAAVIDGEMRATVIAALIIIQVEKDGLVHDILGARPSEDAIGDLKRRNILLESDEAPEVFTFRAASEIHDQELRKSIETLLAHGQESQAIEAHEIEAILDRAQAFDEGLTASREKYELLDFGA